MPKEILYKLCDWERVNYEHESLEPLLIMLGFLNENLIHYQSFVDLLNVNKPMPEIQKIKGILHGPTINKTNFIFNV